MTAVSQSVGKRESGVALAIVIFVLLALVGLGHTALYVASQEWLIARAAADRTGVRHAAEGAAALLAATWETRRYRWLGQLEAVPGASGRLENGFRYETWVRRVGRELYLIESTGFAEPAGVRVQVGRVVWALDPVARLAALPAALTSGGEVIIEDQAQVDGERVALPPPGWAGPPCDSLGAVIDSLYPTGQTAGLAVSAETAVAAPPGGVQGAPSILKLGDIPAVALGPVDVERLVALAERRAAGSTFPSAVVAGETCDTRAPLNWGAPGDPLGPCGTYFPLVAGDGDLTLVGGEGQGVLVVDGDLEIRGDARYAGIVLVRGRLVLGDSAFITGFALADRGATLGGNARLEASACAALQALARSEDLQRAFRIPEGNWIPLFF